MAIYKGQWIDDETGNVFYPHTSTDVVVNSAGKNVDALLNEKSNSNHAHDDRYYTKTEMNSKLNAKLDITGNASNVTNTFTQAATRANLTTGEKLSASLGKIMKWFSDLKTVAFSGSYNDLTNKPTSLKNPTSMKVQLNGGTTEGTNQYTYDGSAAKNINITPSSIGASASNHNHDSVYSKLNHNHDNAYSKVVDGQGTLLKNVPMTAPQNLLINGDFQSWQRGTTEFTKKDSWQYTADMWVATCGVKKVNDGVQLIFDGTTVGSSKRTFQQFIPDSKRYSGKKASIGISINGIVHKVTGTFLESTSNNGVQTTIDNLEIALGWSSSKQMYVMIVRSNAIKTVTINYIDLFEGEIVYKHQKEDKALALTRCLPFCEQAKFTVTATGSYFMNGFSYKMAKENNPIINILSVANSDGAVNKADFSFSVIDKYFSNFIRYKNGSCASLKDNVYTFDVLVTCEPL